MYWSCKFKGQGHSRRKHNRRQRPVEFHLVSLFCMRRNISMEVSVWKNSPNPNTGERPSSGPTASTPAVGISPYTSVGCLTIPRPVNVLSVWHVYACIRPIQQYAIIWRHCARTMLFIAVTGDTGTVCYGVPANSSHSIGYDDWRTSTP